MTRIFLWLSIWLQLIVTSCCSIVLGLCVPCMAYYLVIDLKVDVIVMMVVAFAGALQSGFTLANLIFGKCFAEPWHMAKYARQTNENRSCFSFLTKEKIRLLARFWIFAFGCYVGSFIVAILAYRRDLSSVYVTDCCLGALGIMLGTISAYYWTNRIIKVINTATTYTRRRNQMEMQPVNQAANPPENREQR